MVDTLQNVGSGDIVIVPKAHDDGTFSNIAQFKVYKVDVVAKNRTFYKIRHATGQITIWDNRPHSTQTLLSRFVAETIHFKTVPTTWAGPARSSDCTYHALSLFVRGDQETYQEWLKARKPSAHYGGMFDARAAIVATDPDKPKALVTSRFYTKMDLMCAVILAHGPSSKNDIMRRVAALEGKPWVIGSNSEYFTNPRQIQGCLKEFGKIGAKKAWYVTEVGVSRGSRVLGDVGLEVVKSIA